MELRHWLVAAVLSATTACASAQIVVGQTAGFTGAVAATVKEATDGAALYFDAVNARGGVNGQKIVLVSLDDKFDPKLAAANARTLISEKGAVALFLTRGTPHNELIIPVLDRAIEEQLELVKEIILNEVNVKEMEFIHDTTGIITKKIKPNFKTLGKRYGKQMKEIASAFATLSQQEISEIEKAGDYNLSLPSGEVTLSTEDYEITSEDMPGWLVATEGKLTVALDVTVTDALRREGVARELINRIQNLRKESGFEVTDRINVFIQHNPEIEESLSDFKTYVCEQTLSKSITLTEECEDGTPVEWDEGELRISVVKLK